MSLQPGSRLGPYEITAAIGAGGMGEVYQATDTNLKRQVAVKVLPDSLAGDVERLARFRREAEVLAALNHPNIAQIYGLERSDSSTALVMELVEGPTLADRIARGPIPLDEALPIARQIAEGLEAAHDLGIVHRDLKPANVKVRPDGTVKVLDFGLAKAGGPDASDRRAVAVTNSPTLTSPALMTAAGMILGTAAYMSPEQAKGRPADRRADMWAFGCVLFEMLTGRQTFPGEDVTEVLAAVVRAEPDWSALPKTTPPAIETLLRRCLRKDPRQRLADAATARLEIDDALAGRGPVKAADLQPRKTGISIGVAVAAGTALVAVGALLSWTLKPGLPAAPSRPTEVEVSLPSADAFDETANNLALSPDGRTIAYVAIREGVARLYVRRLASFEAAPLAGTEGAFNPFFSPDSRWIGFFAQDKMKKIPVDGGAAQTIAADAGPSGGASWGDGGTIVYAPAATTGSYGLWRVSADGGEPAKLTTPDTAKGEYSHRYPQILPGGKAVLFTAVSGFGWDESRVEALVLATGERRVLVRGGHTGRYMRGGHLLYYRAGSLLDVPFDPDRLEVGSASPATIADDVSQNMGPMGAIYAVSNANTVAYVPATGGSRQFERQFAWIDRQGRSEPVAAPPRNYDFPTLSPDGSRIAAPIVSGTYELWVYDLARASLSRLTAEESSSLSPVWSPDGRNIAYRNNKTGTWQLYSRPADGSGPETTLTTDGNNDIPLSWSPDGRTLAFTRLSQAAGYDIWTVSLDGSREARPFVQSPAQESGAQFSPDGRWIAYTSDESKGGQVYVTAYPNHERRWQISTEGGDFPQWNPKGGELFYWDGRQMMVVDVTTGATFSAGRPRALFTGQPGQVSPDGQRFLSILGTPIRQTRQIKVMIDRF
jgi:eukaryotic-like serine/threonine-protein kinase